ncbi:MAG: DUF2085 domain-containing protein [Anaerolineales bacterium]|nr:DUF2085 domain-containing protein [Anaerolineales bacterium]
MTTQDKTAPNESTLTRAANGIVIGMARHWLAIFNIVWAIYLFTPFLAPLFMQMGWTAPARVIYAIYSVLCHQLPDHSYFLFGPTPIPQEPALIAGGMPQVASLLVERSFIGSPAVGWKVALCQRDVAIYAGVLLAGLSYALVRRRVRPLPFKVFLLLVIPMAIDGLTQLVGWRESNWLLRTATGALFGVAAVYLAYPYVEDAMQEVLESELLRRAALQQQSHDGARAAP